MAMDNIRILLVDDHKVVLEGFVARLESEPNIQVVATANNGEEALKAARDHQPDVVLMDVSMPIMGGIKATGLLKEADPNIKVLMLTMHDNREYIMKVMQAGAVGYMLKEISAENMIQAIKTVYQGSTYFCGSVTHTLFNQPVEVKPIQRTNPLSRREEMVLSLVAKGHSSKKIANELNISVRTVETHRQNIKHKLDLHSTAELAKYCIDKGLIL